jgi:hypothetical protein
VKLKCLLDRSPNRPPAADTAEAIIMASLPKDILDEEKCDPCILDIFTQSVCWKMHYTSKTLTKELRNILNTGGKYNSHSATLNSP